MRRNVTIERIKERVKRLCSNFPVYMEKFEKENLFTGPSLYFHFRTVEKRRSHKTLNELMDDNLFFEYLYATLTSWGLHRMGPVAAKRVDFDLFVQSIQNQKGVMAKLYGRNLSGLPNAEVVTTADVLWEIMDKIRVSTSETKLVANSKALHHILPGLVPPIDREYTLRFFYGHKTISGRDKLIFKEIFPEFYYIACTKVDSIKSRIGNGFHTSETKVIDNAVVGFVLSELD
jgi:hypothetical protein